MSNNNGHKEARETIQSFINRYAALYPNGDHVELMQLAAFPVAMTVHLLYQIWANFGTFIRNGIACKIDALAVNDCIQSNLFRQTGPELFEMDADVRRCLLEDLRANRGKQFVKEELAAFLYQYSRQNTQGSAWRNYYDAQQWTAIMEVDEKAAAEQILGSLAQELQKKNTSRGLGIVNLIAALEKDNKEFSGLMQKALNKPDVAQAEPGTVTSKRIVLTDEVVAGRTPVKINLPPTLSNRLKKIVKKDHSAAEVGIDQERTVHGLIAAFSPSRVHLSEQLATLLIEKQYIRKENLFLLINPEIANIRSQIEILLSESKKDDIIIILINWVYLHEVSEIPKSGITQQEIDNLMITPQELNDLIVKRFPDNTPDIIVILEGENISNEWYEQKYQTFTLITTGKGHLERSLSTFEKVLNRSVRDITYAQFYNNLLEEFVRTTSHAGIFSIPHLIPGKLDLNQQLFSKRIYQPEEEAKKMVSDMGRESDVENRQAELDEIIEEGVRDEGREKTLALFRIVLLHQQNREANCLWLFQKSYGLDMEVPAGISSHTALWTDFFDEEENKQGQNVLQIVKRLFDTHILFVGLTAEVLSGLNLLRLKAIMNICRTRRILLYFFVEEESPWLELGVPEENVLLSGMILSEYLEKEGPGEFMKAAFRDLREMIGEEELQGGRSQGNTYGIFVGIDNYMDKQYNLHESVSDAQKMLHTLVSTQLLKSKNATLITDNEATRGNVVNSFLERLSTATSEDTVLFYFSGHSSNQQTESALFFHDLDRTSEYTTPAQNGILTDFEFMEIVKAAPDNPTIILILDTHGGSRHWLDENNPKHISLMATHLEEMCYELAGIGGMLTEALTQCLSKQPHISYIALYQSVLNSFLAFAHNGNAWQTPLFIVPHYVWNNIFLSKTTEAPKTSSRDPKNYDYLQTRDTLQCLYYSKTEPNVFTFYNQVKFALHEKRVEFEHLNTWSAIDKSFSVHNRFPDVIFIAQRQSMLGPEPQYNIEKLLAIAEAMQIPVYFILEDESADPSVYKSYPVLPADKKPVVSGEDITKLIGELQAITEPLVRYLNPVEEGYETYALCIGITHYENLPGLASGVQNAWRFSNWSSGTLKYTVADNNRYMFISGSDIRVHKDDIEKTILRIVSEGAKAEKKRVLYIYVCGYAIKDGGDFLFCLSSWAERNPYAVINITECIEALSHANFDQVNAFAEYLPIDAVLKSPKRSTFAYPTAATSPSCFFKVQLNRHDNTDAEKNSIMLDGLEGEAILDNNTITVSSFTNYLHKRLEVDGIRQYPEITMRNTSGDDPVIAHLAPSLQQFSKITFKQQWLLIVGTGKDRLSQPEWMVSNALARELAKSAYGIITGGWPGVDAVAAEAYATQLAEDKILDEGYLRQVVLEQQEPTYPGGLINRVANETLWYEATLSQAYAVIMIGGQGGTFTSYLRAQEANVPVIPIAATGGDAAKAHAEIKERRLLPAYLLDELARPVRNYDDATRIADSICRLLDEGL
ncbi:caspase family protein [Chitinophaga filiformis]|uniref:caspase family protein n=1 Tax=Chitinophaga filiformis TaxID=104663 RepID=UPI001F4150E3|nr:caspase family protein [Chitinophaga filiformis]MCF6405861.1 caspase family protein [Chitinophaga filiformis]